MSKRGIKTEIVREYLKKYPNEYKRALARKIVDERPDIFEDVERVRLLIRKQTGAAGYNSLKGTRKEGTWTDIKELMAQYAVREDEAAIKSDFVLPIEHNKIGLMSDLHIPYHHEESIATAIEYYVKKGINTLLFNGDLVDFYQVSRWVKDPKKRSFEGERDMTLEFFEFIRTVFPELKIYWKLGNHEARFDAFILRNAKELYGMDELSLSTLFHLDDYGIELIYDKQKVIAGNLNILHGHEFGQSFFNPVNPARGLFLRAKTNAIAGHNHQTSEHHENNLDRDPIGCWSTGCLCHLTPEYRPFAYTKWNHGAALVEFESSGAFTVDNFRINGGKII